MSSKTCMNQSMFNSGVRTESKDRRRLCVHYTKVRAASVAYGTVRLSKTQVRPFFLHSCRVTCFGTTHKVIVMECRCKLIEGLMYCSILDCVSKCFESTYLASSRARNIYCAVLLRVKLYQEMPLSRECMIEC